MEGCESRGSVFKPARAGSVIEVARIDGKIFKTMKEAEARGLELARAWVDRKPYVDLVNSARENKHLPAMWISRSAFVFILSGVRREAGLKQSGVAPPFSLFKKRS
jgi:hypothetical protein